MVPVQSSDRSIKNRSKAITVAWDFVGSRRRPRRLLGFRPANADLALSERALGTGYSSETYGKSPMNRAISTARRTAR